MTGCIRDDIKGDAMKLVYDNGASLEGAAKAFGVSRQTVYMMFKRRGWAMRPKAPARRSATFNGRRYTLRNNGYFGATTGDRAMMHRDVWTFHNGPIPASHDIHHLDMDRTNNGIDNLRLIAKDEHTRLHSHESAVSVTEIEGT